MFLTDDMINYAGRVQEEVKQLIRDLCAIPAPSHHEEKRAEFCKNWFEANGFGNVTIDEALNVIAPVNVTTDNALTVVMAHTDTVFPDTEPMPFSEDGEFMYSPGTDGATAYFVLYLLGLDVFFTDKICVFQIPTEELGFDLATKGLVNNAHRHNLAVHYWTINSPDEMRHLINIGADGIMTDYPHLLAEVYAEYKD